uniref:Uncharacterized protein n=1 Tax=Paramoeba aestuarina TaxID=180227 RepID=A0A7S4N8Y7_9EUKA
MDSLGSSAEEFVKTIRNYMVHESRTIRTVCLRLISCVIDRAGIVNELIAKGVYYFVCRCLEREKTLSWERIEAFKVLRKTLEIYPELIPPYCVNSLASVAKDKTDLFTRTALDSLIEIAIRNPEIVTATNNVHVLFDAVLDFPYEEKKSADDFSERRQAAILGAIIYLVNNGKTRNYINLKIHLPILLAPITDAVHSNCSAPDLLGGIFWSCKAVVSLMRSWSGFIVLASEGGLSLLVSALTLPSIDVKECVIDSLFEICHEKVPPKEYPFSSTSMAKSGGVSEDPSGRIGLAPKKNVRHSLLDNFLAAQLQALIEVGLAKGLVELENQMRKIAATTGSGSREQYLAWKATILLGKILSLSNTLLPSSQCARLQTLEELVKRSLMFKGDAQRRSRASTMITNLHQYSQQNTKGTETLKTTRYKRIRGQDRRLDRLDDVKKKIEWRMDANEFRQLLQNSGVLQTKEWQKWDWDIISDIVEGPLENPMHLGAALRTKFVKRLVSFLRPSNNAYSNIPRRGENSDRYTQMACHLLEILIAEEDGKSFLNSNPLLPQLGELLRLEAEPGSNSKHERIFTKDRMIKTLAHDYFIIIGTLTGSKAGLDFLHRHKVTENLPSLCVLQDRSDLCTLIMTQMDYNVSNSPTPLILQKVISFDNVVVRNRATRHLQSLYRSSVHGFDDWGIKFAVNQLNDEHHSVVKAALEILDEASDDVEHLERIIHINPPFSAEKKAEKDLMMKMLTRKRGFQLMSSNNFIKDEMASWTKSGYLDYCRSLEHQLTDSLAMTEKASVHVPPHFFHYLASTDQGCQVVHESKVFEKLCCTIRDETATSFLRRASLWAIGNIGRSHTGLAYILKNDHDIIPFICQLTDSGTCLSLRGTCFFVLGLLSGTEEGRKELDAHMWDSPDEFRLLISVPRDVHSSNFLKIDTTEVVTATYVPTLPEWAKFAVETPQRQILDLVDLLFNPVRKKKAVADLGKMKAKSPELFKDPLIYLAVLTRMGSFSSVLESRRILYQLFNPVPAVTAEDLEIFNFNTQQNGDYVILETSSSSAPSLHSSLSSSSSN